MGNGQCRTGKFTDVASDEWYAIAVAWAEANSIDLGGEEIISFKDEASISDYAKEAV